MSKGGGTLNAWLKEFIALVFTQTIQAFIYAIIISIILFGLSEHADTTSTSDDKNAALGLMSVMALLSVFKVEDMARRIFGVGDTNASPKSAMQGLAKTAIAAQLGKRVLNNGAKVLGGVGKLTDAGKQKRKAKARLNEDMQDAGFTKGADGNFTYTGKPKANSGGGANRTGESSSGTATHTPSGGSATSTSSSGLYENYGGESSGKKDPTKNVRSALRAYEDKSEEIRKARIEGVKDIASGLLEMKGSVMGGAVGAVFGAATTGDIGDGLRGMAAGAGLGDALAEGTVNAIDKAAKFVGNASSSRTVEKTNSRRVKQALDNYKQEVERSSVNYSNAAVEDAQNLN